MAIYFLPIGGLLLLAAVCQAGVINNDPSTGGKSPFRQWPTNAIPYKFTSTGTDINLAERAFIRAAMNLISQDTGTCVTFQDVSTIPGYNGPYMAIQPNQNGVQPASCSVNQGFVIGNTGAQYSIMFGSTSNKAACLGTFSAADTRDAMRVLANSIGLRNEWQRSDRNSFMTFNEPRNSLVLANLQPFDYFNDNKIYASDQALSAFDFDALSITMVSGTRFAADNTKPIFKMTDGRKIGNLARLSLNDCNTLQYLYPCGPTQPQYVCVDPYAGLTQYTYDVDGTGDAIVNRALQCPLVSSVLPIGQGILLAQLVIKDLPYTAGGTPPALSFVPAIPGLTVTAVAVLSPITLIDGTTANTGGELSVCTGATCAWTAKIYWTVPKNKGQTWVANVQVKTTSPAGVVTTTMLPLLTLNINCAPQFASISANVGYSASAVSTVLRETGVLPNGIIYQSANNLVVPAQVYAVSNVILSKYIVNYYMPTAFGTGGPTVRGPGTLTPKKVFVNCNQASIANPLRIGGINAVATVAASDPEGGPISYFAYSGAPQTARLAIGDAGTAAPELHTVTKEGVVLVSTYAAVAGLIDPYGAFPGTDGNGGDTAGVPIDFAALGTGVARDIFIVAVDQQGAYSVLMSRFFFACGVSQA